MVKANQINPVFLIYLFRSKIIGMVRKRLFQALLAKNQHVENLCPI